jgi:ribonuclease HII
MALTSPSKSNPFSLLSPLEGELHAQELFPGCILIGIDEAGRGPLAGPVVAAAVILGNPKDIIGLHDSKKLSESKRDSLYPQIQDCAVAWAIAEASPAEIDKINILQADFLAMRRVLAALGWKGLDTSSTVGDTHQQVWFHGQIPAGAMPRALVDGNLKITGVNPSQQMVIVKGDAHVASIAAASILAKVHRDRVMIELDSIYPQYGLAGHKGYPSPSHIEAIRQYGLSPVHRKSFKPKALSDLDLFG